MLAKIIVLIDANWQKLKLKKNIRRLDTSQGLISNCNILMKSIDRRACRHLQMEKNLNKYMICRIYLSFVENPL